MMHYMYTTMGLYLASYPSSLRAIIAQFFRASASSKVMPYLRARGGGGSLGTRLGYIRSI